MNKTEESGQENIEKIEVKRAYCGACMEDPCMCSDPEQTSTTLDW